MGVIEVLSELHIKDYVLIEERTISFGEGLNVITGETGEVDAILLSLRPYSKEHMETI